MTEPRSPAPPQDSHKRIAGYEILTKLGQGGMGAVYKARQVSLDRLVALKVLPKQLTDKTDFVGRFSREARLTGGLNHPHIIKVYDVGRSPTGIWYYAMEYVEGESLRSIQERQQHLPPQRVARILEEMAAALDHAHKHGVIHRDIKPDNILINREGSVKLADLGLAKLAEDATLAKDASFKSLAGTVVGTPYYMAPEQVEGRTVDIRSDLYSLGATAYHLLAGTPPFTADTAMGVLTKHVTEPLPSLRAQAPGVPPGLEEVIQRLMEKDPAARYQTPAELLAALARIRQEVARATRPGARAAQAVGRLRRTAVGVGLLLLVVVGLVLYAKSRQRKLSRLPEPPAPAVPEDRKAVEKKAQEALEAAEAYGAGTPQDTAGYLARLRKVEEDFPRTPAAAAALRIRKEVEESRETHKDQQAYLSSLRLTVLAYLDAGDLAKARQTLDKAPRTEATWAVIQELEKRLPPWRCDFEHGEAGTWRLEAPFIAVPPEGVRRDLAGDLEARGKVTASLGTAGPEGKDVLRPLEGQASLRLGARALGGEATQGCNGEARGPFFTFRPGERLSLRCRLCVVDGALERRDRHGLPEMAYICLRDDQGEIVHVPPDPKPRHPRSLIRDLGFLYARGLDHNEPLGSPLLPRAYEGAVTADPSKLAWGEKGPRRVQLCAGLSLGEAPGRSVVLILDDIKVSNVEDAP